MNTTRRRILVAAFVVLLSIYGGARLWFRFVDGFRLVHITSELVPDNRREIRELRPEEEREVNAALSQSYSYLGKGAQSYAFASEDGKYVIKFLKYKNYRPRFYYYWFSFVPGFDALIAKKEKSRTQQLESLFDSQVTAFNYLAQETALIYLHLNKTNHLHKQVVIRNKVGRRYRLDMDQMEFIIQKRGELLCPAIDQMMAEGKDEEAKKMLSGLFQMIIEEYQRGLVDIDDALMQNTGVADGKAFQLDIGRFTVDPQASDPHYYHQELFNKYYEFRFWLAKKYPTLLAHVEPELIKEMGEGFLTTQYIEKKL